MKPACYNIGNEYFGAALRVDLPVFVNNQFV